jgi:hypothetical protein
VSVQISDNDDAERVIVVVRKVFDVRAADIRVAIDITKVCRPDVVDGKSNTDDGKSNTGDVGDVIDDGNLNTRDDAGGMNVALANVRLAKSLVRSGRGSPSVRPL